MLSVISTYISTKFPKYESSDNLYKTHCIESLDSWINGYEHMRCLVEPRIFDYGSSDEEKSIERKIVARNKKEAFEYYKPDNDKITEDEYAEDFNFFIDGEVHKLNQVKDFILSEIK